MSNVVHSTDASFEADAVKSGVPVLVDFWAEWCGPCRMLSPILDEISTAYEGKLKVVKVNVDESSATAANYGVRGIPTLLLMKDGQVVGTKVGNLPKSQLTAFIDSNI
ncbi:MAG: thiol reductase thioredoxin [Burkholderiales bacterium]|jgi:thioredoxin 1|nr:thiol reductase thioredoxin [Burkholderiales bacterium]MCE3269502.1 thiol reductase thioredoxin [Burkholderiales bacterium]